MLRAEGNGMQAQQSSSGSLTEENAPTTDSTDWNATRVLSCIEHKVKKQTIMNGMGKGSTT